MTARSRRAWLRDRERATSLGAALRARFADARDAARGFWNELHDVGRDRRGKAPALRGTGGHAARVRLAADRATARVVHGCGHRSRWFVTRAVRDAPSQRDGRPCAFVVPHSARLRGFAIFFVVQASAGLSSSGVPPGSNTAVRRSADSRCQFFSTFALVAHK